MLKYPEKKNNVLIKLLFMIWNIFFWFNMEWINAVMIFKIIKIIKSVYNVIYFTRFHESRQSFLFKKYFTFTILIVECYECLSYIYNGCVHLFL